MLTESNNQRKDWLIEMSSGEVLCAAEDKLAWHTSRLEYWTELRNKVEHDIQTNGITIDKSAADTPDALYSNSGRNPSVKIDTKMLKDLEEANSKITEHKGKVKDFESWVQFLTRSTGNVNLNLADYLYFFGK